VLTLKFEDDLGNQPASLLSVYFPGTAASKVKRHFSVGAPPIKLDAGVDREFAIDWRVEPVRDDPLVTVRLLTGSSLAEYLYDYVLQLLYEAEHAYSPAPYTVRDEDRASLRRFLDEVSNSAPTSLEMNRSIEEITLPPGGQIDFSVRGEVSQENSGYFAVETFTENRSVISDVIELSADRSGMVYEY
jgi:hypothetical protein